MKSSQSNHLSPVSMLPVSDQPSENNRLRVVVFSGGRGSSALTRELATHPDVHLQVLINGYDDGLSTGVIRYYLGDALGPSDYRKNASRLALALGSCPKQLIDILDLRFPLQTTREMESRVLALMCHETDEATDEFSRQVADCLGQLDENSRQCIAKPMKMFRSSLTEPFAYGDCSLGNMLFAGCFLSSQRKFNPALSDYCELLGLPDDLIVNVTNGENAFLVAIDKAGRFLASEADIVNADNPSQIRDFFLISRPVHELKDELPVHDEAALMVFLEKYRRDVTLSETARSALDHADLIVYAPGTQYSSLLPSYVTPGLGRCIAGNLSAHKLLITNIHEDAEIRNSSAVDIIDKAIYYLREKNIKDYPAPLLITHYLVNTPGDGNEASVYIQPGQMESMEDPRLIRISNYEDGITGRHQPDKLLAPFLSDIVHRRRQLSVAILLMDTHSINKSTQTILELVRAGSSYLDYRIAVYYTGEHNNHVENNAELNFRVCCVSDSPDAGNEALVQRALSDGPDYICLCESSGMYHGHDIAALLSNLNQFPVDGVWGSRRLSVLDIHESYKFRFHRKRLFGLISYLGSHLLSLAYLVLYGRYISDTLSGLRLVKRDFLSDLPVKADHPCFNQYLLSGLLRGRGKVFEIPVEFLPMSPDKVKRTSVGSGLLSLAVILRQRFGRSSRSDSES